MKLPKVMCCFCVPVRLGAHLIGLWCGLSIFTKDITKLTRLIFAVTAVCYTMMLLSDSEKSRLRFLQAFIAFTTAMASKLGQQLLVQDLMEQRHEAECVEEKIESQAVF